MYHLILPCSVDITFSAYPFFILLVYPSIYSYDHISAPSVAHTGSPKWLTIL